MTLTRTCMRIVLELAESLDSWLVLGFTGMTAVSFFPGSEYHAGGAWAPVAAAVIEASAYDPLVGRSACTGRNWKTGAGPVTVLPCVRSRNHAGRTSVTRAIRLLPYASGDIMP